MSGAHGRPKRILRLVPSSARGARAAESGVGDADSDLLSHGARALWQSPHSSGSTRPGGPSGPPSRGPADAASGTSQDQSASSLAITRHDARGVVAANGLRREFAATRPNEKWAGDITYVPTRQGWLYLAVLMDLYSRRIVGWAMDAQEATSLTLSALEMALRHRAVQAELLHHSDRGSHYGAMAYQQRLAIRGIRCSMSRPGNCWDNAVVESFFATLKTELFSKGHPFSTRQEARTAIFEYVEGFYNRARRHSTLGYLSPWRLNSGLLTQPPVSTESGEVQC